MNREKYEDHISQGIALMAAENYPAAKKEFLSAIEIDVNDVSAYIHLGNACANLGEYDEALEAFKKALVIEPASGETLYSIGNIYLLKDEGLKAVEYYNKAETAGFKSSDMYQLIAGIFFEAGDSIQALRNVTKAIDASPFDGNLRIFKARVYLADSRFDEALDTLDEMERILPDAFEAYDLRTQIYIGLKQYDKALEVSNRGCERFPEDVNLAVCKLKVMVEMARDEEALALIEKIRSMELNDDARKQTAIQQTIIALRKQDIDEAVYALATANQELDGDTDLVFLLLDIHGKTENYEKVLEVSETLIGMEPALFYASTAQYYHAQALEKLGRIDEAKVEYKKLTATLRRATINDPSFYEGYIYRLLSHLGIEEYDEALKLADYITDLYPDRADGHAFKYFVYKKQGNDALADAEGKAARAINPTITL